MRSAQARRKLQDVCEDADLTVVTGADTKYWRCLYQFLKSAERRKLATRHRFIVFDLGLESSQRKLLHDRFPWAKFRAFPFENYPPHVALARKTYAWKPLAVAAAASEFGGLVLWLDSATVFKTSNLHAVLGELERNGMYTLKGYSPISQRCSPHILAALQVPREYLHQNERVAGVIGFDTRRVAVRTLIAEWRDQALTESIIPCRSKGHNPEQALLSLLLFKYAAKREIDLGEGEVDISSARPVQWMSTRNWVSAQVPLWADPAVRLRHFLYKMADQASWRIKNWDKTRLDGFHRSLWEHFTVFVSRKGETVAIEAPKSSYYADPFVWTRDGRAWLFVEEFDYRVGHAHISCIALDNRLKASLPVPIVRPQNHVSFPLLFESSGSLYMLPETCSSQSVDLYECDNFPYEWRLAHRLLYGVDAADTAIVRHDERWWLVTSLRDDGGGPRYLGIFSSDDLHSDVWEAHPVNCERRYADEPMTSYRNAGNILSDGNNLLRPVQINRDYYGQSAGMMLIEILNRSEFREVPYAGVHPFREIAEGCSPHHYSENGDIRAWDVRDRVGYLNRAPARDKNGRLPAGNTPANRNLTAI